MRTLAEVNKDIQWALDMFNGLIMLYPEPDDMVRSMLLKLTDTVADLVIERGSLKAEANEA